MVTHEHELVQQFNHRVITLADGRIVSDTGKREAAVPAREPVLAGGDLL